MPCSIFLTTPDVTRMSHNFTELFSQIGQSGHNLHVHINQLEHGGEFETDIFLKEMKMSKHPLLIIDKTKAKKNCTAHRHTQLHLRQSTDKVRLPWLKCHHMDRS